MSTPADAATAVGQVAAFEAEQEVRFALVMYGGVSLAIYMYGVAEEFLHLVRATAPKVRDAVGGAAGDLALPEPDSTESVYRKLGRMLPSRDELGDGGPVRTRFVVDIISGTSAGGINGVCLAKALANGTTLAGLKNLWLTEAISVCSSTTGARRLTSARIRRKRLCLASRRIFSRGRC